jgi:hypothetical protein
MDDLRTLLSVQDLDEKIQALESVSGSVPVEIERLREELRDLGKTCEEKTERLTGLKVREREKEGQLEDLRVQRSRFETQLHEAKNNVVYSALKQEIMAVDRESAEIEEEAVNLMQEIEDLEGEIDRERETLAAHESEFKDREAALLGRKREADERLEALRAEREEVAGRLPPGLRKRYDRIRRSKDGHAVVPLKDNICGGCFASIPIQRINEIRHDDELKSCENCGRIIYYMNEGPDER